MKKFVIYKTKEVIWVEELRRHGSNVYLMRDKQWYSGALNVFGTKLFPMDKSAKKYLKDTLNIDVDIYGTKKKASKKDATIPSRIKIGDTVKVKNYSDKKVESYKIVGVHQKIRYKRPGGSYYGNSTEISYIADELGEKNGIENISCEGAVGKSLLGRCRGDVIMVELPGGKSVKYEIIDVK